MEQERSRRWWSSIRSSEAFEAAEALQQQQQNAVRADASPGWLGQGEEEEEGQQQQQQQGALREDASPG